MRLSGPWSWFILAVGVVFCPDGSPAQSPFERYGVILDRKPFGDETVPVAIGDPSKPILPPDQSFTAKFKMAAVTRNQSGVIQVGLVDLKSNRSYMLGVGDSIEGVEVVDADYVNEKARLRRDPEDYWVSMSGGSNHYEFVRKDAPVAVAPARMEAPRKAGPTSTVRPAGQRSSYAARRQSREEARIRKELERLQAEEAALAKTTKTNKPATSVASVRAGKTKPGATTLTETGQALLSKLGRSEDSEMSPEEVNALLQEYQKELIRAGQTPLPIPLTPETDQQLVDEGVLPAQE